ncbi:uncharacterized protein [Musca autumnalis]|uniref:uncharacterized protein n=1 Tax=Musca autumnalis TaxID=221902 RepID=UPI003CEBE9FB
MVIAKWFTFVIAVILYNANEITSSETQKDKVFDWDNIKPGDLLYSLETFIANQPHPNLSKEKLNKNLVANDTQKTSIPLQRRADEVSSEEHAHDYDSAYEAFVQKYFGDSTKVNSESSSTENFDNSSDNSEAETLSTQVTENVDDDEELPTTEEMKLHGKSEQCRNVIKNHSKCRICKNKSGETSENCSYNKETAPKSFAIKIENKYRKQRKLFPSNSKENSSENTSRSDNNSWPTCVQKRTREGGVCYHCESALGERTVQCYSDTTEDKKNSKKYDKNNEKSHQRIYKRTIIHTYENVTPPIPLSSASSKIDNE